MPALAPVIGDRVHDAGVEQAEKHAEAAPGAGLVALERGAGGRVPGGAIPGFGEVHSDFARGGAVRPKDRAIGSARTGQGFKLAVGSGAAAPGAGHEEPAIAAVPLEDPGWGPAAGV